MAQVVVLGSDGWLGGNIHRFYGHDSIGFSGHSVRELLSTNNLTETLLKILDTSKDITVINAIGSRHGDNTKMYDANVKTTYELSEIVSSLKLHFIHFGSASEYELNSKMLKLDESTRTLPSSEYGKSKLAGSTKVLACPRSLVLRLFNVFGPCLPPQNPLVDVRMKIEASLISSKAIQLYNSYTVRDFISINLVLRTLKFSVDNKLTGLYNVCSGVPISFGEIAREIAQRINCSAPIESKLSIQSDFVVGDPRKLRLVSGIYEYVTSSSVVDLLMVR